MSEVEHFDISVCVHGRTVAQNHCCAHGDGALSTVGDNHHFCEQCSEEADEVENDGPAGDFLADYWFYAEGPDEPPGLDD